MKYDSLNKLNTASSNEIVISRIKRIIEKYADVWRVFHEPIQNSIDAIQKREDIREGKISIKVNLKLQKIIISDNGRGFPKDLSLLLPDGTDKHDQSDTMGYQGVGLKSVIYSSNNFKLLSNTGDDNTWGIEISNAAAYLKTGGHEEAPIRVLTEARNEQGTTIEIGFDDNIVLSAFEQIIQAILETESNFRWRWDEIKRINYYLRRAKNIQEIFSYIFKYYMLTHTYIGSVSRLLNCRLKITDDIYAKKVSIAFEIDFNGMNEEDTDDELLKELIGKSLKIGKTLKINLNNKFIDFAETIELIKKVEPRNIAFDIKDFNIPTRGILNDPTLKDQVFCKIMTPDYTKPERNLKERYAQYISLVNPGNEARKGKNIKTFKTLFPKILGIYILIGRMDYYEKYLGNNYGIKIIAANGIPTQHELTARSSNQSFYFNPITFILNIDGKLNEGKTELINQYLKKRCVEYFREAFECTLNRLAKEFVRTVPNTDPPPETDLVDQIAINIKGVDIKRVPVDENTLIALFYQLLNVKGYELPTYGLLTQGVFDGKFTYHDKNIRSDNDLKSLEFKVILANLLNDFDSPSSGKNFDDCDLIIVWDEKTSTIQQQDWRVSSTEHVPTHALRQINCPNWITTVIKNKDQIYKPIIIVKDWVKELDDNFDEEDE